MSGREALKSAVMFLTGACVTALVLLCPPEPPRCCATAVSKSATSRAGPLGGPPGSSVTVVSSFFHEREHQPKEGSKFALLKSLPQGHGRR